MWTCRARGLKVPKEAYEAKPLLLAQIKNQVASRADGKKASPQPTYTHMVIEALLANNFGKLYFYMKP